MKYVKYRRPDGPMGEEYDRLLEQARKATRDVCAAKTAAERKKRLAKHAKAYQEFKPYLKWLFNGRCSFCETPIVRYPGDVEHYRPKAGIDENPKHPGYYWLAFDVENLLLSCEDCNRRFKRTHFPVEDGYWAAKPGSDYRKEHPSLLHPGLDAPIENHLTFQADSGQPAFGMALAKSKRGERSIEIYGLNDGELPTHRAECISRLIASVELAYIQHQSMRSWLEQMQAGGCDYSVASLIAFELWRKRQQELLFPERAGAGR